MASQAFCTLNTDRTAHCCDEIMHNGKAKPESTSSSRSRCIGTIETVKDMFKFLSSNNERKVMRVRLLQIYRNNAASGCGDNRVTHKVQQNLNESMTIRQHRWKIGSRSTHKCHLPLALRQRHERLIHFFDGFACYYLSYIQP